MSETTIAAVPYIDDLDNPPAGYHRFHRIDAEVKLDFYTYGTFLVIAISKLTHEEKDGIALRVYPLQFLPWFADVLTKEMARQPSEEEIAAKKMQVAETVIAGEHLVLRRLFNLFGKGVYGFVIENKSRPDEMKTDGENQMITFPEEMLKQLDIMGMIKNMSNPT